MRLHFAAVIIVLCMSTGGATHARADDLPRKPAVTKQQSKRSGKSKKRRPSRPSKVALLTSRLDEGPFRVSYVLRGLTGLALLGLYLRWLREEEREQRTDIQGSAVHDGVHVGRPVLLRHDGGADPLAVDATDIFQKPASAAASSSSSGAQDLGASDAIKLALEVPAEVRPAGAAKPANLLNAHHEPVKPFPAELAEHFEPLPREEVAYRTTFSAFGYAEGTLALTNMRILAVVRKTKITLFPPRVETELRRHQNLLKTVTMYRREAVSQPRLLIPGALLVFWYPFGTVAAMMSIALFLVVKRSVLTIWYGELKRRYPLPLDELQETLRMLTNTTGKKPLGEGGPASETKRAS